MQDATKYYVYFHREPAGRVFYVGKGTGQRAWSRDRHAAWEKYVAERLNNQFAVEIHRDGLTEAEADALENERILEMGSHLINWANPCRQHDYEALARYHARRKANRLFVADTKPLEKTDLDDAIRRYRRALAEMIEYESMTLETGVVAEMKVGPDWGDIGILDRLTLCLCRVGRSIEALGEADRYFTRFPSAQRMSAGKRVIERVRKHAASNKLVNGG